MNSRCHRRKTKIPDAELAKDSDWRMWPHLRPASAELSLSELRATVTA